MRFFTPAVYQATTDWDTWETIRGAREEYLKHLESLSLPLDVVAVADPSYVDDALVARVYQSDEPAALALTLRRGDLQMGYSDAVFTYKAPEVDDLSLRGLLTAADNAKTQRIYGMTDAWCHEFDKDSDERVVHTILFHNGRENEAPIVFTVRCRELSVVERERPSRRLPAFKYRYRIKRFNASSDP